MSVHFYAREKQCSLCFGGTAETADGGGEAAVALPAAMFVGIAALVVGACTWGSVVVAVDTDAVAANARFYQPQVCVLMQHWLYMCGSSISLLVSLCVALASQ